MLKHHLVVALRHLRRRKGHAALNVGGLALGLACSVLLLLYVQDELAFDRFHAQAERTYRVVETWESPDEGTRHLPYTGGALAPTLEREVPGVENATRVAGRWSTGRATVERGEVRSYVGDFLFAEDDFFDVFDFALLAGDPATALAEPLSVVLTERAARQYFGGADPVGQTLAVEWFDAPVTVTGVAEDPPANSHLDFSMVFSHVSLRVFEEWWEELESWGSSGFVTYVVLEDGASADEVSLKLAGLYRANHDADEATRRTAYLQAVPDVHFGSAHIEDEPNANEGNRAYVYVFSALALFLLAIACINYMNLATARSLQHAREVGVRKAVGARRGQLVAQFLSESVLMALLALGLALGLVALALPAFNALAGKALQLGGSGWTLAGIAGLAVAVGVLAGSYPALYLSGFRPAGVLKGAPRTGSGGGAAALRRTLVVAQFALSILMLVATAVVYDQLRYVQERPLGFDAAPLVVVDINDGSVRRDFRAVKEELAQAPGVRSVSVSSRVPGEWKNLPQVEVLTEGAAPGEAVTAYFFAVDEDFLGTYAVELLEGRNFAGDVATDSTAVLLNETAARLLGERGRVGRSIRVPAEMSGGGRDELEAPFEARIAGVVRDFHFRSLHEPVAPVVLGFRANPIHAIDYFTVRTSGADLAGTLDALGAVHDRFDPGHPFEYNFLDERLADFYANDQRVGRIFGLAALLAVVVACLGLFGLAAYTAEQRTKEVGIRKVLGASVGSLVGLLSKEFARLVLVAFAVAVPLAYLAMDRWLDAFAYRVSLGPGVFLLAGGVALAVALLTVSYHALRAATADPVRSLRYE